MWRRHEYALPGYTSARQILQRFCLKSLVQKTHGVIDNEDGVALGRNFVGDWRHFVGVKADCESGEDDQRCGV